MNNFNIDTIVDAINSVSKEDANIKKCTFCNGYIKYDFNPIKILKERAVSDNTIFTVYVAIISKLINNKLIDDEDNEKSKRTVTICKGCFRNIIRELLNQK